MPTKTAAQIVGEAWSCIAPSLGPALLPQNLQERLPCEDHEGSYPHEKMVRSAHHSTHDLARSNLKEITVFRVSLRTNTPDFKQSGHGARITVETPKTQLAFRRISRSGALVRPIQTDYL